MRGKKRNKMENVKKTRTNAGFTMVEMIIVIAIIAILIAIIAPMYLRFVEDSRESQDVAIATSIENAVNTFVASEELPIGGSVIWDLQDGSIHVENSTGTLTQERFLAQLNISDPAAGLGDPNIELVPKSDNAKNGVFNDDGDTVLQKTRFLHFIVIKQNQMTIVKPVSHDSVHELDKDDALSAVKYEYKLWKD